MPLRILLLNRPVQLIYKLLDANDLLCRCPHDKRVGAIIVGDPEILTWPLSPKARSHASNKLIQDLRSGSCLGILQPNYLKYPPVCLWLHAANSRSSSSSALIYSPSQGGAARLPHAVSLRSLEIVLRRAANAPLRRGLSGGGNPDQLPAVFAELVHSSAHIAVPEFTQLVPALD